MSKTPGTIIIEYRRAFVGAFQDQNSPSLLRRSRRRKGFTERKNPGHNLRVMPEKDERNSTMKSGNSTPERQTNPTAPDLEACQPLLSRTSTLQGSNGGRETPTFTSDKGEARRRAWSNWSFSLDARIVSDAILGLSDGLTVPFALTAGLTALGDTKFVILGGLAELIAGAISMGLGGYVGAKSEV